MIKLLEFSATEEQFSSVGYLCDDERREAGADLESREQISLPDAHQTAQKVDSTTNFTNMEKN